MVGMHVVPTGERALADAGAPVSELRGPIHDMDIASWPADEFLQYYNLENYLFDVVQRRFAASGTLSAFDFFCIVIWKANRAKSRIAERLLEHGPGYADLESAVGALLAEVSAAEDVKGRLRVLMSGWKFRLPMASAILTALYPEEFTVYDVRVCGALNAFHNLESRSNFESLWAGYSEFVAAVRGQAPQHPHLRDKDRFLWAQSFARQLQSDIADQFRLAPTRNEDLDS